MTKRVMTDIKDNYLHEGWDANNVRICENFGSSHLTGKKVKIDKNKLTAIQEHFLCCNYSPSFKEFSIMTMEGNDFKLKIMERSNVCT